MWLRRAGRWTGSRALRSCRRKTQPDPRPEQEDALALSAAWEMMPRHLAPSIQWFPPAPTCPGRRPHSPSSCQRTRPRHGTFCALGTVAVCRGAAAPNQSFTLWVWDLIGPARGAGGAVGADDATSICSRRNERFLPRKVRRECLGIVLGGRYAATIRSVIGGRGA
ncbi:Uncharacterised protein [Mycobacteroides abscessus subsp. abscessus]|nr:Uncharacterised protein [Mycobacteroides abscessus subsp. abscessus]